MNYPIHITEFLNRLEANWVSLFVTKVSGTLKKLIQVDNLLIVSSAVQFDLVYFSGLLANTSKITGNIFHRTGSAKYIYNFIQGVVGLVNCCGSHFEGFLTACRADGHLWQLSSISLFTGGQ